MNYKIINGVYKGPEHYKGHLSLRNTQVTSLGNLESVGGFLNLGNTQVTSLGNLESVGGFLNLYNTSINDLGNNLRRVRGFLDLRNTPIKDLGNLKFMGGDLCFSNDEIYTWKEYQGLIKAFEQIPYEDLPLYLNDKRAPIRILVNQKLKDGV